MAEVFLPTEESVNKYSDDYAQFIATQAALADKAASGVQDTLDTVDLYKQRLQLEGIEVAEAQASAAKLQTDYQMSVQTLQEQMLAGDAQRAAESIAAVQSLSAERSAMEKLTTQALLPQDDAWVDLQAAAQPQDKVIREIFAKDLAEANVIAPYVQEEEQEGWLTESGDFLWTLLGGGGGDVSADFRNKVQLARQTMSAEEYKTWLQDKALPEYRQELFIDNPQTVIDGFDQATTQSQEATAMRILAAMDFGLTAVDAVAAAKAIKRVRDIKQVAKGLGNNKLVGEAAVKAVTGQPNAIVNTPAQAAAQIIPTRVDLESIDAAMANTLPNTVFDGVSSEAYKSLQLIEEQRKRIDLAVKSSQSTKAELEAAFAKQTKMVEKNLDRGLIKLTPPVPDALGTYKFSFDFGKKDGTPFVRKPNAVQAAKQAGLTDYQVIANPSGGYYVRAKAQLDESLGWTPSKGGKDSIFAITKWLRPQAAWVQGDTLSGARAAVARETAIAHDMTRILKNTVGVLDNAATKRLEAFLDDGRSFGKERWYNNKDEFAIRYNELFNMDPTEADYVAYQGFRAVDDMGFYMTNAADYRALSAAGMKEITLKGWATRFADSFSEDAFNGKVISEFADATVELKGARPRIFDYSEGKVLDYTNSTRVANRLTEQTLQELMQNGKVLIRLSDDDFGQLEGLKFNYVLADKGSFTAGPLRPMQRKYLPGGRVGYQDPYFIRELTTVELADEVGGGVAFTGARTLRTAKTPKQMDEFISQVKEGLKILRENKNAPKAEKMRLISQAVKVMEPNDFLNFVRDELKGNLNAKLGGYRHGETPNISDIDGKRVRYNWAGKFETGEMVGNRWNSPRKPRLKSIDDEMTPLLSPFEAQNRALSNAITADAYTDFRIRATSNFHKLYSRYYVDGDKMTPYDLVRNGKLGPATDVTPLQRNFIQAQQDYINQILRVPNKFQRTFNHMVEKLARYVEGDSGKGSKVAAWLVEKPKTDPTAVLRYGVYHLQLGMFNPQQILLQMSSIANVWALHPKYGSVAMQRGGVILNAIKHDSPEYWNLYAKKTYKVAGYKSANEMLEDIEELRNLGLVELGQNHALHEYASNVLTSGKVRKAGHQLEQASTMFVRFGERVPRVHAYLVAKQKWLEQFPSKSATSVEGRKWILDETNRLTFGFTRADSQMFNQIPIANIATQFMSYQLRFVEALIGKKFTNQEKLKLVAAQTAFFGTGAGLTQLPLSDWYRQVMGEDAAYKSGAVKLIEDGMVDWALYVASGGDIDTDFGSRANTLIGVYDSVVNMFDKELYEVMGGAAYGLLTQKFLTLKEVADMNNGLINPTLQGASAIAIEGLRQTIKGLDIVMTAADWARYNIIYDKFGQPQAPVSDDEAALYILGFNSKKKAETQQYRADEQSRKQFLKEHAEVLAKIRYEIMRAEDEKTKKYWSEQYAAESAYLQDAYGFDYIDIMKAQSQSKLFTKYEELRDRKLQQEYMEKRFEELKEE